MDALMPGVSHLGLFVIAGLALNLTPGPDVLCIVTHGLRSGPRAGAVAALGITAGCFVHIAAAALGVGALLAASATAFTVLKVLGAIYLVWTGLRLLLQRGGGALALSPDAAAPALSLRRVFAQAFWTNALNPKVALFFLAFLPQFIAPGTPGAAWSFVALGLLFNVNGLLVNLGWGLLAGWVAHRVGAVQRALGWIERAAGGLFLWFGWRLATGDRP